MEAEAALDHRALDRLERHATHRRQPLRAWAGAGFGGLHAIGELELGRPDQ
jgi:hypothetical protein